MEVYLQLPVVLQSSPPNFGSDFVARKYGLGLPSVFILDTIQSCEENLVLTTLSRQRP